MKINKWVISLFAILILLPVICIPVSAKETPEFRYELSVEGKDVVEVNTGDIITVNIIRDGESVNVDITVTEEYLAAY